MPRSREARSLNAAHADVQSLAARILAQQRAQRQLRVRRYRLQVALPLVLVVGVGSAGYRLWLDKWKTVGPATMVTSPGNTSESAKTNPALSEIAGKLVKQGRLAEAVNRLEAALKQSPEDDALTTSRDLIALDAKKRALARHGSALHKRASPQTRSSARAPRPIHRHRRTWRRGG